MSIVEADTVVGKSLQKTRCAALVLTLAAGAPLAQTACLPDLGALTLRRDAGGASAGTGGTVESSSTGTTTSTTSTTTTTTTSTSTGDPDASSMDDASDGGSDSAGPDDSGDGSLSGTATADSEETAPIAHTAPFAHDGDPKTRWTAANAAVGHYWTLDTGSVHPLSRIEIMWEYPLWAVGSIYDYTVSVSDDDVTYTMVIDRTANTETAQTQIAYFPSDASGRHVRVTVTGLPPPVGGNTTWAGIYEVRVYAP